MGRPLKLGEKVELRDVSFTPRPMVKWLGVVELLKAGSEAAISGLFGKFADKRELQSWPQEPAFAHDGADVQWIDFASDLGDGFHPTYAIAQQLAGTAIPGEPTEAPLENRVLILGGDQVYPSANREAYEDRFVGPYTAALPESPETTAPWLYALPGNHDWYDGLGSFLRLFCQQRWIGGWRTRQSRSYFALRLPEPWWLWAIDIQFDTEIDKLQIDYFRMAAANMKPGDQLVLATAKPSWVTAERATESYRNLAFVERELVPDGVHLVATLTGDIHHYSRYKLTKSEASRPRSVARQRITAGGAGAYLSATHTLPPKLNLRREPWARQTATDEYRRVCIYPDDKASKKKRIRAVVAPLRSPSLGLLIAGLYAALAAALLGAVDRQVSRPAVAHDGVWGFVGDSIGVAAVVVAVLLVVGLAAYADFRHKPAKAVVGLLHAAAHIGLTVAVVYLVTNSLADGADETAVWILVVLAGALAGYIGGSLIYGTYLFLTHRFRGDGAPRHTNEAFAGQAIVDYKCFLRMRVERGGPIRVWTIGIDRVCTDWWVEGGSIEAAGSHSDPRVVEEFKLEP